MKYSKTTLMELSHRYSNILKKCALLNAIILMGAMVALPVMATSDTTLRDAINGDSANVTLSQNTEGVGIKIKDSVTVDFNGKTYTGYDTSVGSVGTTSQLFQILKESNEVIFKNGILNVLPEAPSDAQNFNFKMLVQNYTNLTLDNMVLDGTNLIGSGRYTLSNNHGDVLIKNSTIIGKTDGFAFDVCNYSNYGGVKVTLQDSTIQGNVEIDAAGDISKAVLNLKGKNTIIGDIANKGGTLNISGNLTLDGGITGNGTIEFTGATGLTAQLKSTASIFGKATGLSNVTVAGLVVENGLENGTYKLFENGDSAFKEITATNSLYDFKSDGIGQIKITKKSTEKIVENLTSAGATVQEAATISAIASSTSDNAILKAISTAVQTGNVAQAAQAAKELAPTTSQQVMGVAQGVNNILSNVTGNRMSAMGRAGGDAFIGGALWVQGLYNHTKQDANASSDGFTANTRGIAFGIDGKVNEAITLGLGYGYTNTNADAGNNDVDVDGHNVFAYAQYQPNAWYVNGMISYGLSKYTEEKTPMGVAMKSKYDVDTYSANLTTGYDFENGYTPYGGLRYILAKQDGYNDGAQYIKSDDNDVLTAVAGVKYGKDFKADTWTVKPNIRLAATYDMISDNSVANVNIVGGGNYQITGERLKRFGVETGVGLQATYGDWNLSVDYNGSFKKDFQSHTGMLKAKYNF